MNHILELIVGEARLCRHAESPESPAVRSEDVFCANKEMHRRKARQITIERANQRLARVRAPRPGFPARIRA